MAHVYDLPGHLIRRLHQISVSAFAGEANAAGLDLTPVQFAALSMLNDHPDIDQATLAGLIAYDRVTLGGVVNRLAARGLIERKVSATDRRARQLRLTDAGAALLKNALPVIDRIQETILKDLNAQERDSLLGLLRKMTAESNAMSRAPLRPAPERPSEHPPQE
ncbi:MarR family transcriptional regulator [Salipiger sp. P9]|uniref:MarR family winged helix-turn-helix transcriptional regulator n=1 Tax=Salipiger pentaromativorans TaxID=2943193 RepID=UPI002157C65C|nr:MarR family transcriptional regulator [Salipiger pentaromativorans]MCR8550999.1 MarR family transcriptional regulator [Salipiger pentaromativorans]